MGLSARFYIVKNWEMIADLASVEEKEALLQTASDYFLDIELAGKSDFEKPDWINLYEPEWVFENWKAAFWAGEYYEKLVRPQIQAQKTLEEIDQLLIDLFWIGDDGDAEHIQDLDREMQRTYFNSGLLLSVNPVNAKKILSQIDSVILKVKKMSIENWDPPDGDSPWFTSFDKWIQYLACWQKLFKKANISNAGIIIEAC